MPAALDAGHDGQGYSRPVSAERDALAGDGMQLPEALQALVDALAPPGMVLVHVPQAHRWSRRSTSSARLLDAGNVIVDGDHSFRGDAERRHGELSGRGIRFLNVGTSGRISDRHGVCFMAGGDADALKQIRPLLLELAVDERAVTHARGPSCGHVVKPVHNAIELGIPSADRRRRGRTSRPLRP